jgi:hypothetical protein
MHRPTPLRIRDNSDGNATDTLLSAFKVEFGNRAISMSFRPQDHANGDYRFWIGRGMPFILISRVSRESMRHYGLNPL